MSFGERLQEAMTQSGLRQVDLARRIGTTNRVIHDYRKDIRQPGVWRLRELCQELNVSSDWLLELERMTDE